jgi:hypothetical protein
MVPFFLQNRRIAVGVFFAVLFLLLMPFPILIYSGLFFHLGNSFELLFFISAIASTLVYFASVADATKALQIKTIHALLVPIGSFIVISGFLAGIVQANGKTAVTWRGRKYCMKEQVQNSISV